jgi:hypothetical protein
VSRFKRLTDAEARTLTRREAAGLTVGEISKLLGHSSAAVTARYLDHLTNDRAIAALEAADLPQLDDTAPPPRRRRLSGGLRSRLSGPPARARRRTPRMPTDMATAPRGQPEGRNCWCSTADPDQRNRLRA